ncbi:hypothetical protein GBZ86_15610 [Clostridium tarantellae]|uniref:Uncharacterized protein n=1 Tax=Clostridium tarantellae TaxID=39493 RepID=A0A6I1MR10_9CLOT|nr:hypothetical protein [Clostridium tarantellae]
MTLNAITSGRIDHIIYFKENFSENMFIGTGRFYLESFPLALLMSYGILGSCPIFILSIFPLIIAYRYRKLDKNNKIRKLIILLNIILLINGLFEELSPFGPGVKCYLLWMITGIYLGLQTKRLNKY